MAAAENVITKEKLVKALDVMFVKNFDGEYDRLDEMLGLFPVETMAAGTALYQYKVAGNLENSKTDPGYTAASGDDPAKVSLGASSGTAYIEGDFIKRSTYTVTKEQVGEVEFLPYAKQTTAQAILKGGFENAVLRTDRKAEQQLRASILDSFFTFLGNGTTESEGVGLQAALAQGDADLGDALERNNDNGGEVIHFISRQDAAKYLGKQEVTTQSAFGLTYLQNFLGIENVVLTSKVEAGTFFATPVENIHVYGLDFSALGDAGLEYRTSAYGLIGVHHKADYDHASAETYLVRGASFIPEVKDYIVKGTILDAVATDSGDGE